LDHATTPAPGQSYLAMVLPVWASAWMISRLEVEASQIALPSKVMPEPAFESVVSARSTFPDSYSTR
jgi:hypothetical protein